jgi:hypothetical protein
VQGLRIESTEQLHQHSAGLRSLQRRIEAGPCSRVVASLLLHGCGFAELRNLALAPTNFGNPLDQLLNRKDQRQHRRDRSNPLQHLIFSVPILLRSESSRVPVSSLSPDSGAAL